MGKNLAALPFSPYTLTTIENDVWIGANAIVKAGVRVSTGAIVGTGAVLTKDVGAYEIWAGNPAKRIGFRFDEETRARLLRTRWWEWSDSQLEAAAPYLRDAESFLRYSEGREGQAE